MKLIMKIRIHQMEPESDSDTDGEEIKALIQSFETAIEGLKPIIDTVDTSIQAIGRKLEARDACTADMPSSRAAAIKYPECATVGALIDGVLKRAVRLDLASRTVYPSAVDAVNLFQGREAVSLFEVIRCCVK
jgi:hypothetical protein